MAEGVDGLLRDKTRPSRIARLAPEVAERVVTLTLTDAPGETGSVREVLQNRLRSEAVMAGW